MFMKITECLSYFIEQNRITPEDYLQTKGQDYRNTLSLQVYGHNGEPCPNCGNTLCRTVIGGRSSVYCPNCQENTVCNSIECISIMRDAVQANKH